jgi:hypothetical protein
MPLAIDRVYCLTAGVGKGNPRSTNVIARLPRVSGLGLYRQRSVAICTRIASRALRPRDARQHAQQTDQPTVFHFLSGALGNHPHYLVAIATFIAAIYRGGDVVERLSMINLCIVISCGYDSCAKLSIGTAMRGAALDVVTCRALTGAPVQSHGMPCHHDCGIATERHAPVDPLCYG